MSYSNIRVSELSIEDEGLGYRVNTLSKICMDLKT